MATSPMPFKLLLVDDQALDLRFLEKAFRDTSTDLEAETIGESRAAVERILNQEFDLVILDINMPVLDGFEVITHVRARKPNACPAFIMLSSSARTADMTRAYEAGVLAYLVKPATIAGYRDLALNTLKFWSGMGVRAL